MVFSLFGEGLVQQRLNISIYRHEGFATYAV